MKKIFFISAVLWLMLAPYSIFAQSHKTITISGFFSDSYLKSRETYFKGTIDIPQLFFYNEYNDRLNHEAEIIPIRMQNNRFTIKVNPKGKIAYFILNGFLLHGIFSNVFLVQAGDSVCLVAKNENELKFMGKGARKLNYQLWMGKQWDKDSVRFQKFNLHESIAYYKNLANNRLKLALDSLKNLNGLDDSVYNVLRLNTAGAINANYLLHVRYHEANDKKDSLYKEFYKGELTTLLTNQSGYAISDPFLINNSFLYIYDLYTTLEYYARLKTGRANAPFDIVYGKIKSLYTGLLRDKLIVYSFLKLNRTSDVSKYYQDAILTVSDSSVKQVLRNMQDSKTQGAKAYDFSFEGIDGKMVNLRDLHGKVIVLDTWFNGCPGCIGLAEKLRPIEDSLKNNKSVIFLGINVDKDKQRFIDGVKGGLYGSKETIYAYTNGLGQFHPMLLYYNYVSYPNLLIIGKDGNIISANPPLPFDNFSKQQFLKLINNGL